MLRGVNFLVLGFLVLRLLLSTHSIPCTSLGNFNISPTLVSTTRDAAAGNEGPNRNHAWPWEVKFPASFQNTKFPQLISTFNHIPISIHENLQKREHKAIFAEIYCCFSSLLQLHALCTIVKRTLLRGSSLTRKDLFISHHILGFSTTFPNNPASSQSLHHLLHPMVLRMHSHCENLNPTTSQLRYTNSTQQASSALTVNAIESLPLERS